MAGCGPSIERAAPPCLSIATGGAADVSYLLGDGLSRLFDEQAAPLCLKGEPTDGSTFNVKAVDDGSADFALARADTTYIAFTTGTPLQPRAHTRLRGVAIVYSSVLHVVVRADSTRRDWRALRNRGVGFSIFSDTDLWPVVGYRGLVAAAGDLGPIDLRGTRMRPHELNDALAAGQIDGGLVLTAYPAAALRALARRVPIRMLEVDAAAAARIRAQHPFFKPVVVPAGVYAGQHEPVRTIGVENLLVAGADVDEEAVYRLTRTLLAHLPRLAHDHEAALQVSPDLAPATPIPLHRGAARYYRERELLQ